MIRKKIIICSIVKNESTNLDNLFSLIFKISNFFLDYYIIIVESDSSDQTYQLAKQKIKSLKGKIIKVKTNKEWPRTKRISYCRNIYINFISAKKKLKEYDYAIIIDADKVNNKLNLVNIKNTIKYLPKNWIGFFPNQKFIYYDLYALRIKKFFNFDCFEKMITNSNFFSARKSYFLSIFKNFFIINKFKQRFIKVESAFGGMAFYKLKYILKKKYSSQNGKYCEHVSFNKSLLKKGKYLYIDRKLINSYGLNNHFFKGIIYSISNFFSQKLIDTFKFYYVDKKNPNH